MGLFSFGSRSSDPVTTQSKSLSNEQVLDSFDTNHPKVSEDLALKLIAVFNSMYVISSSIAQLPIAVMRKNDGVITVETNHPASRILSATPNIFQTSYKWRETEMFKLLGHGNSYSMIIRDDYSGDIIEIRGLPPSTDLNFIDTIYGRKWFYTSYDPDDGHPISVDIEDMIHLKDVSFDEKKGKSRIRQHADAIGWGLSLQEYGKSFFGSNGRPTGVVSPKQELTQESWNHWKGMWNKQAAAMSGETNKTLMLPAEVSYSSFTVPPEDMQFLDSRKFSRSEIAGLFNVPPHMIGDLEKATFSNISEQALQFVRHTIMPWVKNIEEEFNRKLFTDKEILDGYYVKLNLAGLLRGTPKERAEFYRYMIEDGVYSRNEVRALEDSNPIDGLDEMVISQNVKSVRYMDAEADIKEEELKEKIKNAKSSEENTNEESNNEAA
ncbi:TPA: phage portal protein [Photobacterium damselae]